MYRGGRRGDWRKEKTKSTLLKNKKINKYSLSELKERRIKKKRIGLGYKKKKGQDRVCFEENFYVLIRYSSSRLLCGRCCCCFLLVFLLRNVRRAHSGPARKFFSCTAKTRSRRGKKKKMELRWITRTREKRTKTENQHRSLAGLYFYVCLFVAELKI